MEGLSAISKYQLEPHSFTSLGHKRMTGAGVWRSRIKSWLPLYLRRILRSLLHYSQRVGRWGIILWQVRGIDLPNQSVLVLSALASPVLSMRNLMGWQDPILLRDTCVHVPSIGEFSLRAHCDDLWHVLPHRERAIVECLKDHLRPGDVFIDAGANIGIYTVMASKLVGPQGKVIAIEMMPDTADRLEHHIGINRLENVTVIRAALSHTSGEVVEASVESGKFGQASIMKHSSSTDTTVVKVKTIALDEISCELGSVRLMKMDLEGAEKSALAGAHELLLPGDLLHGDV